MLKLMLELSFSFCISKKPDEILIFRIFIATFWIFVYFLQNIAIFRSGMFLWRHDYVTPWPILLILVCMNREGPYLPIDTNLGKGLQQPPPPWLDVLQKIARLDEGYNICLWLVPLNLNIWH